MLIPWFFYLRDDEQLLVESLTSRKIVNGPGTYFARPLQKITRRRAVTLEPTDYIHIRNTVTGQLHSEVGPGLYFPGANEEITRTLKVITLKHNEYIKIIDKKTGAIRTERGEKSVY